MNAGDLNLYAVFVQIVDDKSFRAAARALGMSKSTASAQLARLEGRLGARLLERTTRSLRLTDAGAALYQQAQPALSALREAERAVSELQARPAGRLRLAMPVEPGQFMLGPALAEYMRRHPKVGVRVELTDRFVDLVDEGFDVALRPGPLPDSALAARKLGFAQRLCVYASPAYLRRRGAPRRPEELSAHDCLLMSSKHPPGVWPFVDKQRPLSVEVKERMRVNSFAILRDLAVAGRGVARLPELFGRPAVREGALRPLLDAFCPPPAAWYALYPSARNLSPKVRALLEVLEESFARLPRAEGR